MAGNATDVGNAYLKILPKLSDSFGKDVASQAKSKTGSAFSSAGSDSGSKFSAAFGAKAVAVGNLLSNAVMAAASAAAEGAKAVIGGAFENFAEYEQLSGGVEKIFDTADVSAIMADAQNAYKDLNMSANEYMSAINQTGAQFAQTMGDQKGYDTARQGMLAIADYASGTGRSVEELTDKFSMITRSTSSYQSIADQFAGILPATSADFLEQAQAAGLLEESYTSLSEVPIDEYQAAVSGMLEKGVDDMGLAGNTALESAETISGSLAMLKGAWDNLLTGLADPDADIGQLASNLIESLGAVGSNCLPAIQNIFAGLAEAIPQAFSYAVEELPGMLEESFSGLIGAIGGTELGQQAQEMFSSIQGAAEPVIQFVIDNLPMLQEIGGQIGDLAGTIGGVLFDAVGSVFDVLAPVIDIVMNLGSALLPVLSAAIDVVSGAFEYLGTMLTGALDAVAAFLDPIAQLVDSAMPSISSACEAVGGSLDSLAGWFGEAAQAAQNDWQGIADFMSGLPGTIVGYFSGLGSRIANAIGSIHFPKPHLSWESVSVAGGAFSFSLPHVDWYAKGFATNGISLLGIGEEEREALVPLEGRHMQPMADAIAQRLGEGTGGTTNVYISGVRINDDADIAQLFYQFMAELNRKHLMYT